ncbi:MAG TPA: flagellar basal-body rod protein FlgF [Candidatus Bathyarchaeia archaeon]|nr:flagellar basal-body rod protein FlgF [Candidatus Bathyarchaeia archaeon]
MIHALSSGMHAQWQRHEILANNLANASTVGFKQDNLTVKHGEPEAGPGGATLLGRHVISQWTDFSQGGLRETDRSLDVALSGPGFFVVQTPAGPRYTRAGAFSVSPQGTLMSTGGFPVLGQGGPITVRSSNVTFGPQGEVLDDGRTVDTLRVVDFPKPYVLVKESHGLFAPADPKVQAEAARDYQVVGGALENSNVNAVRTMVDMIDLLRKYEAAHRAIQAHDEADRYPSNDMGRLQ